MKVILSKTTENDLLKLNDEEIEHIKNYLVNIFDWKNEAIWFFDDHITGFNLKFYSDTNTWGWCQK